MFPRVRGYVHCDGRRRGQQPACFFHPIAGLFPRSTLVVDEAARITRTYRSYDTSTLGGIVILVPGQVEQNVRGRLVLCV